MDIKFLQTDQEISRAIASEFGEGYLEPLPSVEIEAPKAMPGQTVSFHNYRSRVKESTWGIVLHVETHWSRLDKYEHVYEVKPVNKKYTIRIRQVELIA